MAYELRHFDTPLLRFEAIDSTYAAELNITWINEEKPHLLPLDLEPDGDSLFKRLKLIEKMVRSRARKLLEG